RPPHRAGRRRTLAGTAPRAEHRPGGGHAQRRAGPHVSADDGDGRRRPAAAGGRLAMTFARLLLRNLFYHRRGNLAVLLGVAVGTAVLTGALLVGDSLRGSLLELTLDRLGWVEEALVANRFFREKLASAIHCPAILLQGSATAGGPGAPPVARRAGRVTILGVNDDFWPQDEVPVGDNFWRSADAGVVLNASLAADLKARVGDRVTLRVQKASAVPRESLLGRRKTEDVVNDLTVTVRAILPDTGLGRFSLKPDPAAPRNAFVPLAFLQKELDLKGRINAILAGKVGPERKGVPKELNVA